jgi:hypothetical protein
VSERGGVEGGLDADRAGAADGEVFGHVFDYKREDAEDVGPPPTPRADSWVTM